MNSKYPLVSLSGLVVEERETVGKIDGDGYPVFGVTNVDGITLTGVKRSADLSKYLRLKPHQFAYNPYRINVGSLGLSGAHQDGIVSPAYVVFAPQKHLDTAYLYYYLKSAEGNSQINYYGNRGSVRAALRFTDLCKMTIPLPPLSEQCRIVKIIDSIAQKIQEARAIRQQTEKEADSLVLLEIAHVFTLARPYVFLSDTTVCCIVCGQHLNPEEQAQTGIPYITGPADFGPRQATPSRFACIPKAIAEPGDVLLTVKGAGVGKVNLAPPISTVIGRQLYALRPNPVKLDQVFLWYALQFKLACLRDAMTATTVPGIGRKDVEALDIPLPSISEQCRIVAYLDDLQAKINKLKDLQNQTAAELDALLPSILDNAFKGQL